MPLKVELKLKSTRYCVKTRHFNNIIFTITNTKLYFPGVTFKRQSKTIKTSEQRISKISVLE